MKKLFLLLAFFFGFFLFPPVASAEENFLVSSDVTYKISPDTTTHVVMQVNLTNLTSKFYASEYKISVGFSNITNVVASDPDGTITPGVIKNDNGYTIRVGFNRKVVGIEKTLPFTISFDTPEIAQKQGDIYEVDIPGIANQNDFASFNVHVRVPQSFGAPTYIKPNVGSSELDFSKQQLGKGGISIAFGSKQVYAFTLTYHLKNSHVFPVRTEIALPPDTNYQQISLESLSPLPQNVNKDEDGNWLAQYSLLPSQEITVTAKGKAVVHLTPVSQPESVENLRKYLMQKPFWETNNSAIASTAKKLQTPEAIYQYVVSKLSYDFSRVTDTKGRIGAAGVLQNPSSAVCLEFTDLFVALARAAGIPAREVDGFAYTQDDKQRPLSLVKDILHAWPEYYDKEKETWIMVDPTWGNTTGGVDYFHIMDFDHFAFTIKGMDSTYPVPAGGYKTTTDANTKDVHVGFVPDSTFALPHVVIEPESAETQFGGVSLRGQVRVSNPGGTAYPSQKMFIVKKPFTEYTSVVVPDILPFGSQFITFSLKPVPFLFHGNVDIMLSMNEASVTQHVTIKPFYFMLFDKAFFPWNVIGGVLLVSIAAAVSIITYRTRRIPVSR